jgi:hypothetical protein
MKKLPEYFAIKRKKKDPRWKQYIAYLNGRFGVNLDGTSQSYPYYGYGGRNDHMDMYHNNPAGFLNTVTVLTLDEFFECFFPTNTSQATTNQFPAKWCIKDGLSDSVTKFFNKNGTSHYSGDTDSILHYPAHNGKCLHTSILPDYTEISLAEFQEHVLGIKSNFPTKWTIRPTNETESVAVLTWFNANGERKYGPGDEMDYYWHFPAYEPTNHCLKGRIFNSSYTEITFAEFQKHVLKETHIKTQPMTKTYQVKKAELEQIHGVACGEWKTRIAELTLRNPFGDCIELTQTEVDNMFAAATESQRTVLVGVFGEPNTEIDLSNAEFDGLLLFERAGNSCSTMISVRLGGELQNKAFYLNSNFTWEIKEDARGETCLVPTRK